MPKKVPAGEGQGWGSVILAWRTMNRLTSLLALALLLPATAAADPVVYKVDADHSGVNQVSQRK